MATTIANVERDEPYDIYIGRGSIWGNQWAFYPGTMAKHLVSSRAEAVRCYEEWIVTRKDLLLQLRGLKDKRLGCHCHPLQCHGHILIQMADNYEHWEKIAQTLPEPTEE